MYDPYDLEDDADVNEANSIGATIIVIACASFVAVGIISTLVYKAIWG